MVDRLPTLEDGLAEREALRDTRQRNYEIKNAAGWSCQHPGCTRNIGVVVVELKDGFGCRCVPHIGRHRVAAGQWYERSAI